MNKEQLELEIKNKNNALDLLKSNILSESEKIKKENLEDQQKKIEDATSKSQTKKETTQLKNEVEVKTDWTYELIQGSIMENKLKEIGKTDLEIKEFAENIDKTVRKYLDQELE